MFMNLIFQNLFSWSMGAFVLGGLLGLLNKKCVIPSCLSQILSFYLIAAIGLKGGIALAHAPQLTVTIVAVMLTGLMIGFLQPFLGYALLRLTTPLDPLTAVALAAHYGSISVMTFATAEGFLRVQGINHAPYLIAVLAMMEVPAIFSALFIAHFIKKDHQKNLRSLLMHLVFNKTLIILFSAFITGWLSVFLGFNSVRVLLNPFYLILYLFLFEMGTVVVKNTHYIKDFTWPLILFGLYMPLLGALAGLSASYFYRLDVGTGTLFTVLCASASYIAVPACMRFMIPEAKPAIYLPMSLGITFPFNVIIGIPFYYSLALMILR
jgi:hypothetical protein